MYKITYGGALTGKEEQDAIMEVVKRNWWPLAGQGKKMEAEAAKFLGMKHGILLNSGSSAGLVALTALELPKGSGVIIPATTFPTIFNIILQCGLTPVVVDSTPPFYNVMPSDIEAALKKYPYVKAVICVHAVGNPCDMPAIMKIAKKYGVYVIEDNCDGWGGKLDGKMVGSFADVSITSFHAAHIVAMGQGGGIFTNNDEIAYRARLYRDWGRQADTNSRTNHKWPTLPKDYDSRFIYEKVGYNLGPLELQAAMGRVQLRKVGMIKRKRQRNFTYLYKKLKKFSDGTKYKYPLTMPVWIEGAEPSWFSFPLSCKGKRGELTNFLEKNGIETRSMFAGNIIKHPAYKDTTYAISHELTGADWILENSFWISCHPRYSPKDLKYVVDVFEKFYAQIK